ncbi:MAG: hypothetical protein CSA15_04195 [Candidatus Delongbacteria bacterium]|nr:MAG: hypothetical protein CSA15_04195 [Candidatus Delongbacteria bacterium]
MFEISCLSKSFGEKKVLKKLSLKVRDKGVVVTGDIGTGKTTLFEILSGEDREYEGFFTKFDSSRIGYLVQNNEEIFFHNTVREELSESSDKGIFKLKDLLEFFNIDKKILDTDPFELPRSLQKIISIIITITQDKDLFLLDEPDSSLSLDILIKISNLLKELSKERVVFIISHSNFFIDMLDFDLVRLGKNGDWCLEKA